MNRLRDSRAFTLVEMLVVIALIAILTAIAVPTMNKLGMFGRDPLQVAARQTLVMLKAARIYAGAHNIDTAVAYSIGVHMGSRDSNSQAEPLQVIDGIALVRRLTQSEWNALYSTYPARLADMVSSGTISQDEANFRLAWVQEGCERPGLLPFVPVKGNEGAFTPLQRGAVLSLYYDDAVNPTVILGDDYHLPDGSLDTGDGDRSDEINGWGTEVSGLLPIRIVDNELNPLRPRLVKVFPPNTPPANSFERLSYDYMASGAFGSIDDRFPAHVFKPSGVLETSNSEKARFIFTVIPDPEASPKQRFLENGQPVPAEEIEIYSTIGRIQAAS